ncbi:M23 family metallopeptidase [Brevibacillus daliensis]|uniref:M23 family metallopeptidase n=1 Tax=Brevibacillus daliensis TaxID=2892995 RepID=UPI001E5BA5C6|nr:M23 family metallopeptidase [Brevibacillus daliensis]
MFDRVEQAKERRRQRMQQIVLQSRDQYPPHRDELHDPPPVELWKEQKLSGGHEWKETPPDRPYRDVLRRQVIMSLILFGIAYIVFQSTLPVPHSWKQFSREVMTRDFNFNGVAVWYQQVIGHSPSFLPVFSPKQESIPVSSPLTMKWNLPQNWKVVKPYDPNSAKIVLDLGQTGDVINNETGWVLEVGEKPGYGKTVVVQYANGREVWFGNLEVVHVKVDDWLSKGDIVGKAKTFTGTDPETRYLYLSVKQRDSFIDPLDVITVE